MQIVYSYIIPALAAFIAVNWSYFKILRIAKDKGIVDNPDARKLQKTPIPVLGGIAVFFGVVVGILTGTAINGALTSEHLVCHMPLLCALIMMLYTGAMDDMIGLTPRSRFIIEILTIVGLIYASGVCVDNFHGLWTVGEFNWWAAVPLTVFAGVGIINAINMIDGVNGLSSGLCITCCMLFAATFYMMGDICNAMLAIIVAAALVPFFFHNVFGKRSRMFIGDAGTMMMGVLMTWFVMNVLNGNLTNIQQSFHNRIGSVALVLAILSLPVFDTIRVMFMRILQGKSPFHPDKTHLHHVFVRMGVSHSITSAIEISLDLLIVAIWLISAYAGASIDWQLYIVIIASVILVWGAYFMFHWHEERHTEFMHRLAAFGIRTHLTGTRWWMRLEAFLDGPEAFPDKVTITTHNTTHLEKFYHFDKIDPENYKEIDRKRMYDFIKGKAEVYVDDIKQRSGANRLRVDALIFEGMRDGFIRQVKEDVWGTPLIITLAEDN